MLVDIHAHLDHYLIYPDLDKVIERCRQKSCIVITSGVNKTTNRKALEIEERYKDVVKVSLGLFPLDALKIEMERGEFPRTIETTDVDEELDFIKRNKDKIVAIGECGLDMAHTKDKIEEQKKNFLKLIELAEKIKKPLIVHSRKAEREAIEILKSSTIKKIIMHCYTGKMKLAKKAADNGYYFSIPPVVVRIPQFKLLVEQTPVTQLFTETDTPYLSATPGKRNEPIFVEQSVEEIAKIKNLHKEEVEKNIFMNFQKVFLK